jgi:putative two-component system response regulator
VDKSAASVDGHVDFASRKRESDPFMRLEPVHSLSTDSPTLVEPLGGRPTAGQVAFDAGMHRPSTSNSQPLHLLLVDDEDDVLAGLHEILRRAHFRVTTAASVPAAVAAMQSTPFDLILTDLYLGATELGVQIAQAAHRWLPRTPVIVLTGRPTFDGAQEALRNHVADIVVKPVDPEVLLATCHRVLHEAELTRRNQELESVNAVLSTVIPRTIEIKDPTTSGHAARVVGYTDALARRCGVGAEDRASLRLASLLHDIGKIGVPDQILRKPGGLTADEMDIIKRHPAMGYEVLSSLRDHDNVRTWVYQHHEKWDGTGYPNRLSGEEVALPGRILVLAEVYDALAEERSYKPAWPMPKITGLFRDQAGKHFDPNLAHMVADGLDRMGSRFFAASADSLF